MNSKVEMLLGSNDNSCCRTSWVLSAADVPVAWATAAACADVAGVYKNYHQSIMSAAYDGPYTDELFRVTIPSQVGIYGDTLGDFRTCYDTKAMAGFVQGVEDAAVKVGVNSLLDGIHTQVDVVVANILAEIIVPLIPQAFPNLKPGGYFLASGIIDDKAAMVRQKMLDQSFVIDSETKMGDWHGIIAHKPAEDEE